MAPLIRCFFLISFLLPAGTMAYLVYFNPGFADGLPYLTILISMLFIAAGGLLAYILKRILHPTRLTLMASEWIKRLGHRSLFPYEVGMVLAAYLFLFSISYGYNTTRLASSQPRLVVMGWDGATWDLILPLLEDGKLPNLQRLMHSGGHGVLQSLEPMDSPALWTSIATGLPQEKHGVTGFFATRQNVAAPRIWDVASAHGLKVGLYAWMVTWPVHDSFSFVIPSWMARSTETRPSEYACVQELKLGQARHGGPVHPWRSLLDCARQGARLQACRGLACFFARDYWGLSEEENLASRMLAEARLETDMFLALLRRFKPDVATFSLYGSDKLAHRFWHYMTPEAFPHLELPANLHLKSVIVEYYQEADQALGRIQAAISPDTHLVVISDHGMKADPAAPRRYFADVPRLLETVGAASFFRPSTIQSQIILEPVIPDPSMLQTTLERLRRIHFSESNEPVFEVERDEQGRILLRTTFSLSWHPESPLAINDSIHIEDKTFPVEQFFFVRTFSGTHDPRGIILISGPAIIPGSLIDNANLLDIAPTLLYLLDLPISRELPGRVLMEAVSPEYRENHLPRYTSAYPPLPPVTEKGATNLEPFLEQLRSVGYVQ